MSWPFPTEKNPLRPWTAKQRAEYARQQREKQGEAPWVAA